MTHFVLVPGAWLGAWAWDDVAAALRDAGHGVTAVTLSGLAERGDIPLDQVGQATHVADIVGAVEAEDLRDVVLVGHSYSGVPVGQAAGRIGDRLNRVVYVDSHIAHDGVSFVDNMPAEVSEFVKKQLVDNDGNWPPGYAEPADLAGQDLSDGAIAVMMERSTPHPGRTLTEPVELTVPLAVITSTYIKCVLGGEETDGDVLELVASSPRWRLVTMETGHWPMFSQPAALAALLADEVSR
jgi:pimeloyl-ACP methyl ester carboxylesterase